jgi:hypothetical protein
MPAISSHAPSDGLTTDQRNLQTHMPCCIPGSCRAVIRERGGRAFAEAHASDPEFVVRRMLFEL